MYKKLSLCIVISSFLINSFLFSQTNNYNWITPNKTYLKLLITEDGIYRINKNDFTNAGINTSSMDPRTVKVLYKGTQIPLYFQGEQDGVFNDSDYFDFYGTRNPGGLSKVYNEYNQIQYTIDEYYNQYSDNNVYWIDWGGSSGQRMTTTNYNYPYQPPLSFFNEKIHFEKDKIFSRGESTGGNDFRSFMTERFKGEGYYRGLLSNGTAVSDTFSVRQLYGVSQNSSIRVAAYPLNVSSALTNEHRLRLSINSHILDSIRINDFQRLDTAINFPSSYLSGSAVNLAGLIYFPLPGFNGQVYIDFIEIQYPRSFQFESPGKISINTNTADTSLRLFSISKYSNPPAFVYDVSKNLKLIEYSNNPDTLNFLAKTNSKIEVVNALTVKKPKMIYQKQVPNLVSSSTGVDYLVIYNKLFQSPAEQLRSYRQQQDNFRSYKAEIEDIYDVFNYGIENPAAVRNFVKNIYDTWPAPKLKYICLFGRGSIDPKGTLTTSNYFHNYVPVYGFPTSDSYFANMNIGSYFYYDQIAVGRLPAYSIDEAQNMVDNIIRYESQLPSYWWKNYIFIAGGGSFSEQQQRQSSSNYLINTYISPIPLTGNAHRIYRNDTASNQTYNFRDSIRNDINNGAAVVNFLGHAGGQDWEVGMTDPVVLNNAEKFPLILSMTCYTGMHSDTYSRGFGEKFTTMDNKGAIGFVGTSGWSFDNEAGQLNSWLYYAIKTEANRRLGDIIKSSKQKLSIDSSLFAVIHTVNSYCLLGDPACKLLVPKQPEFCIENKDYKLSNDLPSINEPSILTIYTKNYGLYADSCKIRFQLKKNNLNYSFRDTVLRSLKYSDSAKFYFSLDSLMNYSIDVSLDYENWYQNENKRNNNITINLSIKNNSAIPLKPVNNSSVKTETIVFTILNPLVKYSQNIVKCLLQLDTTKSFNSPAIIMFARNNITNVTTKFKSVIPILNSNVIYYWRTNAIVNGDSTGWSQAQMFSYNPLVTTSVADIKDKSESENISDTGNIQISKFNSNQFAEQDLTNTVFRTAGIKLSEYTGNIYVKSYGSNAAEASYFSVIDKNIYIDGGSNPGLNILKVRKINGSILQFKNFKMTYPNSSDSVLSFLNTFDSTQYLLALTASYVEGTPSYYLFNSVTRSKIMQFGSTKSDSVRRFGWFDSWAFIGFLNALTGQTAESFNRFNNIWIPSVCSINPVFRKTSGTASNIIGPAHSWKDFSWQQTLIPLSNILFDVIGIDKNGIRTTLFSDQNNYQLVDLNSINSFQYPKLDLVTKISIDTNAGNQSSSLNLIKADYTPPAELILNKNSFIQSDTITEVGKELKINFEYSNVGYVNVPGVIVNIYKSAISNQNILKSDTVSVPLNADNTRKYNNKFKIPYFRLTGNSKARFLIEVIPKGEFNEFYTYNNYISFEISLINNFQPHVEVYSDGRLINNGDFVSKNPEIKIHFKKVIPVLCTLSDSSNSMSFRNRSRLIPEPNADILFKSRNNIEKPEEDFVIQSFHPLFIYGENKFKIIYKNEFGEADTIDYTLLVSDEFMIKDFYNYPNPMKNETTFIFKLTGSESFYSCVLNIYTISGRLIKKITYNAVNGANQITWDGRDNDGDYISNGTYLYKMFFEGEINQGLPPGKLAILK